MRSTNHAFVNQLLLCTLFTICFSGTIGLGTVWMRHQISVTANASRVLEARLAELDRHLREGMASIETQQYPGLLKQRNQELSLNLAPPAAGKTVRVTDDPGLRLAAKHNIGLFGDVPLSVNFNDGPVRPTRQPSVTAAVSGKFKIRFAAKD
jgi:hypothetical protein